jgi:hypothetical protein
MRTYAALTALFCAAAGVQAQEPGTRGFAFGASYQGSANSYGAVSRIDLSGGYFFKRHWQMDLGIPFYVISPSDSAVAAGAASARGIGNVYTQLRFVSAGQALNYMSTLTATAPTGDPAQGLSTGRVTVDWGHYFDRSFGRFTPFGEIGVANSVSDTTFFVRPYTTLGFLARGQAGARYRVTPWAAFGASGYVIEPAGSQTVISRVVRQRVTPPQGPAGNPPGRGAVNRLLRKPVFEDTTVTIGTAGIARDRGFSGFLLFGNNPGVNLYGGFTRSTQFDLNTVFFGIGYNLSKTLGGI